MRVEREICVSEEVYSVEFLPLNVVEKWQLLFSISTILFSISTIHQLVTLRLGTQ